MNGLQGTRRKALGFVAFSAVIYRILFSDAAVQRAMAAVSGAWLRLEHGTLFLAIFMANAVKWAVFGRLSDRELLILRQKAGYTLWEFCAGFLVFWSSTDMDMAREVVKYAGLFSCVLLVKSFRYLVAHRVEQARMEHLGCRRYLRLALGMALVNLVDALLIYKYLYDVIWHRFFHHNVLISLFGYELLTHYPSTLSTSVHLAADIWEVYFETASGSPRVLFVVDFALNLLKFALSCLFSVLFMYYYTVPFHMVPSSYTNLKMAVDKARSLVDLIKGEMLLQRLRRPSAAAHVTCIICYDNTSDSGLDNVRCVQACGHRFHYQCLRSWLDYSPTCPTCRRSV